MTVAFPLDEESNPFGPHACRGTYVSTRYRSVKISLNHFRFISVPWTMVQRSLGYSIATVRQRVRLLLVRYGIAVVM